MAPDLKERVSFPSHNKQGECLGVLFGNPGGHTGGIIVLHDWWGLTDAVQDIANRISLATGLVTLAPDIYRGKVATSDNEAEHYMDNLDWDGAVADIQGAGEFLKAQGCAKIGVVGKCLGGALALATAVKLDDIVTAATVFCGIPDQTKYNCTEIKIPIQLHFGVDDENVGFSSKKDYEPLKEKLDEAEVDMEFYEYNAGHGFTNTSEMNYLPGASKLAMNRCEEFMKRHLRR